METRRILCFGDSNTWGYIPVTGERYPRSIRWTGVMAELLGSGFEVIEEGQNGRTTVWDDPIEGDKSGLRYLPACLESHKPLDLVILMLGTNDLKTRFSLPALDIAAGAERLVRVILHSDCGVNKLSPAILLAVPPPVCPQGNLAEMFLGAVEKSKQFAGHYAVVAQRWVCDYFDVSTIISVDQADGIHYNPEAHSRLGVAMANRVRSILSLE